MPIIRIHCPKHLRLEMPSLSVECNRKIKQEIFAVKELNLKDQSHINIMYLRVENKIDTVFAEVTLDKKRGLQQGILNRIASIVTNNILCSIADAKIKNSKVKIITTVDLFNPRQGGFSNTSYMAE